MILMKAVQAFSLSARVSRHFERWEMTEILEACRQIYVCTPSAIDRF